VKRAGIGLLLCAACACGGGLGGGNDWVKQPLVEEGESSGGSSTAVSSGNGPQRVQAKTLGGQPPRDPRAGANANASSGAGGGRVLGHFRNTYYDFPREADHTGELVDVMSPSCQSIAKVPRGFHDAVCVQGSGSLKRGGTISFAKRDCDCAQVCPRTGQKICFDALDPAVFPWGRGAAGKPITPLRTLAADTSVLPLGTVVYLPELDGAGEPASDGCFVVEDRGVRVQGEHVDIFTGHPGQTAILNRQVPSNQGVTVVVEAPKCARLSGG
jgi:3D (Asp-Asp-Asp) domain-containing protein